MLPVRSFPIKNEDKFKVLDVLSNGYIKLFIAKAQKHDPAILSQIVLLGYEHLMEKYSFFEFEDIDQIFFKLLNGEIELNFINHIEFLRWVKEYFKLRGLKNTDEVQKNIETTADIYKRQEQRRKEALSSGKFKEHDNNPNDRILLNYEEAVRVGAISPDYAFRISEFTRKQNLRTVKR